MNLKSGARRECANTSERSQDQAGLNTEPAGRVMYFYDLFLKERAYSVNWSTTNLIAYECKPELTDDRAAFVAVGVYID